MYVLYCREYPQQQLWQPNIKNNHSIHKNNISVGHTRKIPRIESITSSQRNTLYNIAGWCISDHTIAKIPLAKKYHLIVKKTFHISRLFSLSPFVFLTILIHMFWSTQRERKKKAFTSLIGSDFFSLHKHLSFLLSIQLCRRSGTIWIYQGSTFFPRLKKIPPYKCI